MSPESTHKTAGNTRQDCYRDLTDIRFDLEIVGHTISRAYDENQTLLSLLESHPDGVYRALAARGHILKPMASLDDDTPVVDKCKVMAPLSFHEEEKKEDDVRPRKKREQLKDDLHAHETKIRSIMDEIHVRYRVEDDLDVASV